jgi:hypothetical protein
LVCRRSIRATSARAEFLFTLEGGHEAWVCGPRCAALYEEDAAGAYDTKGRARVQTAAAPAPGCSDFANTGGTE